MGEGKRLAYLHLLESVSNNRREKGKKRRREVGGPYG